MPWLFDSEESTDQLLSLLGEDNAEQERGQRGGAERERNVGEDAVDDFLADVSSLAFASTWNCVLGVSD